MTCLSRDRCSSNHALQLLLDLNGCRYPTKLHVIPSCSGYHPAGGKSADLRPALAAAGIMDLCVGCPEGAAGECHDFLRRQEIGEIAEHEGRYLTIATVTCVSGLVQIGQKPSVQKPA